MPKLPVTYHWTPSATEPDELELLEEELDEVEEEDALDDELELLLDEALPLDAELEFEEDPLPPQATNRAMRQQSNNRGIDVLQTQQIFWWGIPNSLAPISRNLTTSPLAGKGCNAGMWE